MASISSSPETQPCSSPSPSLFPELSPAEEGMWDLNDPCRNRRRLKNFVQTVEEWHWDRELAFLMGLHDRIGSSSLVRNLGCGELADCICRLSRKPLLCVIGGKDPHNKSVEKVEAYDSDTYEWREMAPMPNPRRGLAAATLNGKIYCVGGQHTREYTAPAGTNPLWCLYHPNAMVQSYSPLHGEWRTETPLQTPRSYLAAAACEDVLYSMGGFEGTMGNTYLNTVEQYNPNDGQWSYISPMQHARSHLAAAELKGRVYALGGYASGSAMSCVESYDAGSDRWISEASLPLARDSLAAVALGGKVYVLGGCTSGCVGRLAVVESYDPRQGVWEAETSMPSTRVLLGAATYNGRIYVSGGNVAFDLQTSVHSYDARTGEWQEEPSQKIERSGLALAVL